MDAFTEVTKALDERERQQRLRELQVALEAAEYAASRLAQLDTEENPWSVWQDRYCNERTLVVAELRAKR